MVSIQPRDRSKYQVNALAANLDTAGVVASLGFSGLRLGRTYRLTVVASFQNLTITGSEIYQLNAQHDGAQIATVQMRCDAYPDLIVTTASTSIIFVATDTSVSFEFFETGSGRLLGSSGSYGVNSTFTMLEELPLHTATTEW